MKKLMVKAPGSWDPTDKFAFTGKWKCGTIYTHSETDVHFEVKFTQNFIYRWWKNIPATKWMDTDDFLEVNICD